MIVSSKMCKLYLVVICGRKFYANLLIIDSYALELILRIDWLSIFHVMIEC